MKRLLLSLTATAWISTAVAAERAPAIPDYTADKVASHTYVIHGPTGYPSPENKGFMNNPAFIVTAGGVVVIDPGSSVQTGEMLLRQIRKVTDKHVAAVLNTHAHGDHWLGNHAIREAYPQVPIYGHPNMIEAIKQGAGEQWLGIMDRSTNGATRGTIPMGPNHAVDHGDELTLGGFNFRFHYAGPAHSTSDVMIEVVQDEVLFLGDNVNNRRIVRLDDGKFSGSIAAIDMAREVPAKVLVPGHGKTADWEMVDAYHDYLKSLYEAVRTHMDDGMSDFEMKDKIAVDLARFNTWGGFEDELGKHISLAYLELEAEMF